MRFLFSFFILFFLSNAHAEPTDLTVLTIDGIGSDLLNELKHMEGVDWWLEMGDKLIVSTAKDHAIELPTGVYVDSTLPNINTNNLAFHILGHCDHSETNQILHDNLKLIYLSDSVGLINTSEVRDKKQLLAHSSIVPFEKNKILAYQFKNRSFEKNLEKDSRVIALLEQVDKDRWFSQVEYLAGLNRMLEADLIVAGEWLENKFKNLGFTTSRVSLHSNYRGFNILGFKQGTSRADDWYVVGAHLDSRNRNWNDNLPSPGAEDNASGCSGVLEIANIVSQYETQASIVFMCFIEEESGLLGSKDVVKKMINDGDIDKVKSMLNMDMISYRAFNKNSAIAGTNSRSYQYLAKFIASKGHLYTDLNWQVNINMCCTDFVSFAASGVPAVTSNQPDISSYFGYHSVNDLPVNLDPTLASGIIKANLAALAQLAGLDYTVKVSKPDYTGMWYNPEETGHGLQLESLELNNQAILYATWFAHVNGEPIWLTGSGPLVGNQATVNLLITDGHDFPVSANPRNWGELNVKFDNLNQAKLTWQPSLEGFETGELAVERLTIPTLPHEEASYYAENPNLDACLTGSYYDPEHNGEGIQITALGNPSNHLSFNWYTYLGDKQFWFTGQGDFNQDTVESKAYYTKGVNFTPDFNPNNLEIIPWGDVTIRKTPLAKLEVEFTPNLEHSAFEQRTVQLIRNSSPFSIKCGVQ